MRSLVGVLAAPCAVAYVLQNKGAKLTTTKKRAHASKVCPHGSHHNYNVALVQSAQPGAGTEGPAAWYKGNIGMSVYKDAYFHVKCVTDQMQKFADMHSTSNKMDYSKWAKDAEVSVIRYSTMVDKIQQQGMTPDVCYQFCRTVPGMAFFGITNGRDCYCTPYFKEGAGDSSTCDSPCDGDSAQMCGGPSKSDIWQMHTCMDLEKQVMQTGEDMEAEIMKLEEVMQVLFPSFTDFDTWTMDHCPPDELGSSGMEVEEWKEGVQMMGQQLMAFSKVNADPAAGTAAQMAFEAYKELRAKMLNPMCKQIRKYFVLLDKDITFDADATPEQIVEAEKYVEDSEAFNYFAAEFVGTMKEYGVLYMNKHAGESMEETSEREEAEEAAFETFYSASMLLDTEAVAESCQGEVVGHTRFLESPSECAKYCLDNVNDGCEAFQYFHQCETFQDGGSGNGCGSFKEAGFCYLLKDIQQVSMYTKEEGCSASASSCYVTTLAKKGFGQEIETAKNDRCFAEV